MKVIMPMAGYGKRMRPLTWSRPKPLLNVAGNTVLGHTLDRFAPDDVDELVFITGWLGERIVTEAAAAGNDVIVSPTSHCYIDYPWSVIDLAKIYSLEPVPAGMPPEHAARVLGGEREREVARLLDGSEARASIEHARALLDEMTRRNR